MANITEDGDVNDIKRWGLLLLCDAVPWSDGASQVSCVPRLSVCSRAGCEPKQHYSFASTCESVRWMQTIRVVWIALLFTLLLSWTQRQSCGHWCWRRIKIKKTGMCILKRCSPRCKRWTPSQQALRHAYIHGCLRQESVHHPGRSGTELVEAVRCFQPQIPPTNIKTNHLSIYTHR